MSGSTGSEQNSSPWMKWRWPGRTAAHKRSPSQSSRGLRRGQEDVEVPPEEMPTARLRDRSAMPHNVPAARSCKDSVPPATTMTVKEVEALESRLMTSFSSLHQQMAADKQEADRLSVLASTRLDARHSAQEAQHERLERCVANLSSALQSSDSERESFARRLAEIEHSMRSIQTSVDRSEADLQRGLEHIQQYSSNLEPLTRTVVACEKELQRLHSQRLRPIEDRLLALESHSWQRDGWQQDLKLFEDRLHSLEDCTQHLDLKPIEDQLRKLEDRSQPVDLRIVEDRLLALEKRQQQLDLGPLEDRLCVVEDFTSDVTRMRASQAKFEDAHGGNSPCLGSRGVTPQELQQLKGILLEELRVIHGRCSYTQHVMDDNIIEPLQGLKHRVDKLENMQERQQHAAIRDDKGLKDSQLSEHQSHRTLATQDRVTERDARGVLREGVVFTASLPASAPAKLVSDDISRGFSSPCIRTAPPSTCESGRVTSAWSTPESRQHLDRRKMSELDDTWGFEARLVMCERAEDEIRQSFAQKSSQLARSVQGGFADVREHIDQVVGQIGQLSERVQQREEKANATVEHGIVVLDERLGCLEVQGHEQVKSMEVIRRGLKSVHGFVSEVKDSIDMVISDRLMNTTVPFSSVSSLHVRLVAAEEQLATLTQQPLASRAELEEQLAHAVHQINTQMKRNLVPLLDMPAHFAPSQRQGFEGEGPMEQAEELLCMAAGIVERQQRELCQLMGALDVRGLNGDFDDSEFDSSSPTERNAQPDLNADEASCLSSRSASDTALLRPLAFVSGPDAGSGTPGTDIAGGALHAPLVEDEDLPPSLHG